MAYGNDDAYCAVTDVQKVTQMGTYAGATVPTQQQVYDFMASRAGEIYAVLFDVMSTAAPGPVNYATNIDATTDQGLALTAALLQINATGAAIDALQAAGAGEVPARSERVAELFALWKDGLEQVRVLALMYQGHTSRTATHISVGEITEASVTAREEDGLPFTGETDW